MQMKPYGRKVAILGGSRIPFARSNTAYSTKSNQDMLTAALRGLVDKFQLHGERIGEVAAGAVLKHSRDFNLCRESVMSSGLAPETAAYDRSAGRRVGKAGVIQCRSWWSPYH